MDVLWKIVLTVGLLGSGCRGSMSCKDSSNADVSWFILYKQKGGFEYLYTDSNNQNLRNGNLNINHQNGVLAKTLQPYFDKPPSAKNVAYNDQPPTKKRVGSDRGHSKGVVMMDATSGVWILHSTPRFPSGNTSNDFYPKSGKRNAQIFICVTFSNKEFNQIARHLERIKAYRFNESEPNILQDKTTEMSFDQNSFFMDFTSGGQKFKHFVRKSKDDLYDTIAETLKSNLYIQTWRSKSENMHPSTTTDNKYKLNDIRSVKTAVGDWTGSDHSKWCVSEDKQWTCIADLNRYKCKSVRPGGALCIENKAVTEAFLGLISDKPNTGSTSNADPDCNPECDPDCDPDSDDGPPTPKKPKQG